MPRRLSPARIALLPAALALATLLLLGATVAARPVPQNDEIDAVAAAQDTSDPAHFAPLAAAARSGRLAPAPVVQGAAQPAPDQTVTEILVQDDGFVPAVVTVTVGSVVTWRNVGQSVHSTTSDQGLWNWTLVPGARFNARFLAPGTYPYHCIFHRSEGHVGRVVVTGQAQPSPTPPVQPTAGATVEPGGDAIVFDYYADEAARGHTDLYLVEPDGSQRRALTDTPGISEAQPSWSPDKGRVAYAASAGANGAGPWALFRLDLQTGASTQLTQGPEHYEPDWRPDGGLLAFTRILRSQGAVVGSEIAVVAPDGGGERAIVRLVSSLQTLGSPSWSPLGRRLAFVLGSSLSGATLYAMDADGRNAAPLLRHAGWDDIDPAWSPDGRYVAFASGPFRGSATIHDIWLLDLQTGAAGAVAQHPTWDLRQPAWSPDGTEIVFNARFQDSPPRWALYRVPATGGAILGPLSVGVEPDWTSGSLVALPTPPPDPTATPDLPPSPPPFPTIATPEPSPPGPTATAEPPPTFPPPTVATPVEPTPTPPTPGAPTPEPVTPTATTPSTDAARIFLPLAYKES